jgi:hypothetical protein
VNAELRLNQHSEFKPQISRMTRIFGGKSLGLAQISCPGPFVSLLTSPPSKACCEMSRRDGPIVARHELPGTAPPKRAVPWGTVLILAGVCTDSLASLSVKSV